MSCDKLSEIYRLLFAHFGKQYWWPGDTKDEIITGAILTQNTSWQNVEKAIGNLKAAEVMSLAELYKLDIHSLAELIRPAGYYNIKAKRLKSFLSWLFDSYSGNVETLTSVDTQTLRAELLGINGIGRETADSILLYVFERPVFVVDTYTYRILVRHQLISSDSDYEQMRDFFESNLENSVELFNEYHALLVCIGKQFCKPKARCSGCPLEILPHSLETEY